MVKNIIVFGSLDESRIRVDNSDFNIGPEIETSMVGDRDLNVRYDSRYGIPDSNKEELEKFAKYIGSHIELGSIRRPDSKNLKDIVFIHIPLEYNLTITNKP